MLILLSGMLEINRSVTLCHQRKIIHAQMKPLLVKCISKEMLRMQLLSLVSIGLVGILLREE